MIVSWDLLFYIMVSSFLCGFSFKDRVYWASGIFAFFVLAGVVAAIGGGAEL